MRLLSPGPYSLAWSEKAPGLLLGFFLDSNPALLHMPPGARKPAHFTDEEPEAQNRRLTPRFGLSSPIDRIFRKGRSSWWMGQLK